MSLQTVWFVLIAVLWGGYFLLEGFDFGVGELLPFLPRSERDREAMFDAIGPVWDGNEVWLVVAGALSGNGRTPSGASGPRSCGAWPWPTSSTACRSTRTATGPAASGTCSA